VRTRVKICGITRLEDAISAIKYGCDALGFVFYKNSPRYIDIDQANEICSHLPPFVSTVGLFVNPDEVYVNQVLEGVNLNLLQFHGDELPEFCKKFHLPYIKAIRVKSDTNLLQCEIDYADAKAMLLDSFTEGIHGGTGKVFDWKLIPSSIKKPIILAGGLKVENVEIAIQEVKPYAVDVSGGVESAKGIKDIEKIAAFMRGVRNEFI